MAKRRSPIGVIYARLQIPAMTFLIVRFPGAASKVENEKPRVQGTSFLVVRFRGQILVLERPPRTDARLSSLGVLSIPNSVIMYLAFPRGVRETKRRRPVTNAPGSG